MEKPILRGTTILGVRHQGGVAMGGDGQVTLGETVVKHMASKIRRVYNNTVLVGFSGAAADAFSLLERLEGKLEEFNGNLERAAMELAKDWRTDRYLRRLEALLAVMDRNLSLIISGEGDLIAPDDGVIGIGSGGAFAASAARAYIDGSRLDAKLIVERSLKIAASICIYTNDRIVVEEL